MIYHNFVVLHKRQNTCDNKTKDVEEKKTKTIKISLMAYKGTFNNNNTSILDRH